MSVTRGTFEITENLNEIKGKVIVVMNGRNFNADLAFFGLDINTSEGEIIRRIEPVIREEFGQDLNRYKVNKDTRDGNVFIIPNSTAGGLAA